MTSSRDRYNVEPPSNTNPIPLKRNLSAAEAIMDLEQLEQLQDQAERMKGLGNKHMANQEYTKAYNAYSAALQLSPVGPNSHVFLSNRAAALLSLKKYTQAASDARRSIGLAPEFSKAHARLGQALYFLKDYAGAVKAYLGSIELDPENRITRQYLEKAQRKMRKQQRMEDNVMQVHMPSNRSSNDKISSQSQSQSQSLPQSQPPPQSKKETTIMEERKDSYSVEEDSTMSSPTLGAQREFFRREFQETQFVSHTQNSTPSESSPSKLSPSPNHSQKISPKRSNPLPFEDEEYNDDDDNEEEEENDEEDPDVLEARQLYDKGNQLLQMKEFRYAIDEFSAGLFLCPDHPHLSFQLCVGRANAHNHSRRHEAAANDARMAIGIRPDLPHGYSLLGRSLFYLKDYAGTVIALEESIRLMQPQEEPNVFDKAYLTKAQDALAASHSDDQTAHTAGTAYTSMTLRSTYTASTSKSSKHVPKLKPPRFVPREDIVPNTKTSNHLPPMPSQWPAQSKAQQLPFRIGNERHILFGEGPLGIKLNRGCDGFIRVLSTYTPKSSQSPNAKRSGQVLPGDIVREAAGVDLRRPLTNVMWGDTVALVRMAPRPLTLILAKELSTPPPPVLDELGKAAAEEMQLMLMDGISLEGGEGGVNHDLFRRMIVPSPAMNEESVEEFVAQSKLDDPNLQMEEKVEEDGNGEPLESPNETIESIQEDDTNVETVEKGSIPMPETISNSNLLDDASEEPTHVETDEPTEQIEDAEYEVISNTVTFDQSLLPDGTPMPEVKPYVRGSKISPPKPKRRPPKRQTSFDTHVIGADILFDIEKINTTLPIIPWSATESTRKLIHHSHVLKLQKTRFWGEKYVPRVLVLYRNPSLLLLLRRPDNLQEVKRLLDLPRNTKMKRKSDDGKSILDLYYVAESAIDLKFCKLRLSPLTTETSAYITEGFVPLQKLQVDPRRRTCFQLITPTETYSISLDTDDDLANDFQNIVVETSCWETAMTYELHNVHTSVSNSEDDKKSDQGWKHQIVLGTLHSHVLLGDSKSLSMALSSIASHKDGTQTEPQTSRRTQHSDINIIDDDGWTALHYACSRRASIAVSLLITAGANCSIPTPRDIKTPCHLAAERLDEKSLSYILGATSGSGRPNPNAIDTEGYTPMHLASVKGRNVGGVRDPIALQKCLSALEAWGGQMILPSADKSILQNSLHPISLVASQCRSDELDAILSHSQYVFPLSKEDSGEQVNSIEIKFDYALHMALIAFRKTILMLIDNSDSKHNAYESALYTEQNESAIAR